MWRKYKTQIIKTIPPESYTKHNGAYEFTPPLSIKTAFYREKY